MRHTAVVMTSCMESLHTSGVLGSQELNQ